MGKPILPIFPKLLISVTESLALGVLYKYVFNLNQSKGSLMTKIKSPFSSLIIFALMTTSLPAHAGFFDSINEKISNISDEVSDQIKQHYGWNTPATPEKTPSKVQKKAPEVTPANAVRASLSQCHKYLGYMYNSSYESEPKKIASIYLNAALDFTALSLDARPGIEEVADRNKCALLALELGADPDSNGEDKKEGDPIYFERPTPLSRAVHSNNEGAVKILLDHKADPNIPDSSMGASNPLLNTAIYKSQEIALALINAGADLTTPHLLWIASGNAADLVVDQLILSKKIPVNQLVKFTDYTTDEEAETALDASENTLFALLKYKKKFASNSKVSLEDKIAEANHILYYHYPLKPQLKMSEKDPDAFMIKMLSRQQNVSNSLKSAGWKCNLENCGILEMSQEIQY